MHTNGLYTANKTAPPPQATQARGPKPHQGRGGGDRHQRKTARKTKFSSPHFLISAIQILNFDFPVPTTCVLSPQLLFFYLPSMNPFWLETGSPAAVPHHPGVCASSRRMRERTQCPGGERGAKPPFSAREFLGTPISAAVQTAKEELTPAGFLSQGQDAGLRGTVLFV